MENRMKRWVMLGSLGAMAALYFSLETGKVETPKPVVNLTEVTEPKVLTVDDTVLATLPALEASDMEARQSALEAIEDAMADTDRGTLSTEVREVAAKAVIAAFQSTSGETPDGVEAKKVALGLLIGRLGGDAGRAFTAELLGGATSSWTLEALQAWVKPGSVNGLVIREKAAELAKTELVPDSMKPVVLRKALGKKAEPELVALLNTAIGPSAIAACAVELQNLGKVEVMGPVLSRLEEAGMLQDHKKLPWVSAKLLSEHIRKADVEDLKRALRVAYLRPGLTKHSVKAIQERANHPSPDVRKLVARIIPDAVKSEGLDVQSGEELLLARLKEETDATVKSEIEGSLAEVRRTRPAPEATPTNPVQP